LTSEKGGKGYVHLLENDSLGVGGASEGGETEGSSESLTLVVLVSPTVLTASGAELASGLETSWFSFTYISIGAKMLQVLVSSCVALQLALIDFLLAVG